MKRTEYTKQTTMPETTAAIVDTVLKENYKEAGATAVAKLLNERGLKTPRGKSFMPSWVTNRAQALGLFRGTGAKRRVQRRIASQTKPAPETFRASFDPTALADIAGVIATAQVSRAMKLAMFAAIV